MSLFRAIGVFCPHFRLFQVLTGLHAVLHKILVPYVQQFYTQGLCHVSQGKKKATGGILGVTELHYCFPIYFTAKSA